MIRSRLLALVLLLLVVLLWRIGEGAVRDLDRLPAAVTYGDAGEFTATDYDSMGRIEELAGEPLPFALWSQKGNRQLSDPVSGRRARAAVLLVRGDSRLVLPVDAVLGQGDAAGCLLNETTAVELFGPGDPAGNTVELDGRVYQVRGGFRGFRGTVVLQAAAGDTTPLPYVTVADNGFSAEFLQRHSLDPAVMVKTADYRLVARLFSRLPLITAALIALALVRLVQRSQRAYPVRYVLATGLLLALITAEVLVLLRWLPPALIPSRWSDFEFWGGTWRSIRDSLEAYLAAPKHSPDRLLLSRSLPSLLGFVSASMELWVFRLYRENRI